MPCVRKPARSFDLDQSGFLGIGHTLSMATLETHVVRIPPIGLAGALRIPASPCGVIVFAHGSGSSRLSPRNVAVAETLAKRGHASLLFDLLTAAEDAGPSNIFDIDLLTGRLISAVRWARADRTVDGLAIGLFGASTGAAAALVAAAELGRDIAALVSRGGRPDLAGDALERVSTPTLMIVSGADEPVIRLNRAALAHLKGEKSLGVVPGATHLLPETGALEAVIEHAAHWFDSHLSIQVGS